MMSEHELQKFFKGKSVLVTGVAGFIGYWVAEYLLWCGAKVVGIDNLNEYYDSQLKLSRLALLEKHSHFVFRRLDLSDGASLKALFPEFDFDLVVHLAAQAGVRYSIDNPDAYTESNLVGFMNILEACRDNPVDHLVYASSSSVYGNSSESMFTEEQATDRPVSLYAATKKANEALAYSYAHLYQIPTTGLRFFTVYGPMGRPDMAYFKFAEAIRQKKPIDIYNEGDLYRDFTYIDDIVDGLVKVALKPPAASGGNAPHRILNIGNNKPVKLSYFVELLEQLLGCAAVKNYVGMQAGDVYRTCANIDRIHALVGFTPATPIEVGLERFVEWFREYRQL
ncbi:NAD-dependent epimerase/dehydratase family protein [Halioxenophilus sp. WMMB6]|uniref:NAD-dependent epimerase/dehydratase family protein n=1 Tax=Halioxenophilus sp. WMMB6 TaxID=3073815 RepID=UPI00295EA288|nr:NAD-dependent epimerase/dehydratase family protein [Halioxenophilus sp. WMMB6]